MMCNINYRRLALAVFAAVLVIGFGVANGAEADDAVPVEAKAQTVAKVVFIDMEKSCECTRKRIDGSWKALQDALGDRSDVAVERIHVDTQGGQADPYRKLRPMVTVPAIYLLDAGGAVVDLLQGEVTADQIKAKTGSR